MSTRPEKTGIFCHRGLPAGVCVLWLLVACLVPKAAQAVGSWTPLKNKVAERISTILLLSDGTVIAENGLSTWYRLTPDTNGSYVNGAWSTIAPMHDTRLHFLTYVLPDGRVFVAGSEYGTGINTAAGGTVFGTTPGTNLNAGNGTPGAPNGVAITLQ